MDTTQGPTNIKKIKIMNKINLLKRMHLLNGDVVEVKLRISKLVILDIFLSKNKVKFLVFNLGFESDKKK